MSTHVSHELAPEHSGRLGRDFWLFFSGQTISNTGTAFTRFALPLLVFQLTGSANDLALVMVSGALPYLLFGLHIGALLDRVDRKKVMVACELTRGLLLSSVPVAAIAGHLDIDFLYAINFLQAGLGIAFQAGQFAAVPMVVGRANIAVANGRLQSSYALARVVGPVLAGALVSVTTTPNLLAADAASFAVSGLTIYLIRVPFNGPRVANGDRRLPRDRSRSNELLAGLRYTWRDPLLHSLTIVGFLVNFLTATTGAQLILFAHSHLNASAGRTGILFASGAIGGVVLAPLAGPLRRRSSPGRIALACLLIEGLGTALLALNTNYIFALLVWAITSGVTVLFNVNIDSLRQEIAPTELLGRVLASGAVIAYAAATGGVLVGAAVIGATHSIDGTYFGIGLMIALTAVASARSAMGARPVPACRRAA
jgi:MFS family permease